MKKQVFINFAFVLFLSHIIVGYQFSETHNEKKKIIEEQENEINELLEANKERNELINTYKEDVLELYNQIQEINKDLWNNSKEKQTKNKILNMTATAYTSECKGCSGITYSGYSVKNTIYYKGYRIIAANFDLIPLYSIVEVETRDETFKAVVLDTGSAIRNSNVIDVLVNTYEEAIQFGRQHNVKVTILREGK